MSPQVESPPQPLQEHGRELLLILLGTVALVAVDHLAGMLLDLLGIRFPSFVFAMVAVFAALSLLRTFTDPTVQRLATWFTPSCTFLGRWMALFFLPPLVLVPTRSAPLPLDLALLVLIGGGGFLATFSVAGMLARGVADRHAVPYERPAIVRVAWSRTVLLTVFSGLLMLSAGAYLIFHHSWARWTFGVALSVVGYSSAEVLRDGLARRGLFVLGQVVHPVLLGALVIAFIWQSMGFPLSEYLAVSGWSAGGALSFLLRPSVVALAFALDAQRRLIRARAIALVVATLGSSAFSLFFTAYLAGALDLGNEYARAIVSRSVTTPVALSMAELLGANGGLTATIVILTGVLGALLAEPLGRWLRFDSSFVLGVATGAASHGIGTAALARDNPVAAAFSGVTFALVAVFSALLVSQPLVLGALLELL